MLYRISPSAFSKFGFTAAAATALTLSGCDSSKKESLPTASSGLSDALVVPSASAPLSPETMSPQIRCKLGQRDIDSFIAAGGQFDLSINQMYSDSLKVWSSFKSPLPASMAQPIFSDFTFTVTSSEISRFGASSPDFKCLLPADQQAMLRTQIDGIIQGYVSRFLQDRHKAEFEEADFRWPQEVIHYKDSTGKIVESIEAIYKTDGTPCETQRDLKCLNSRSPHFISATQFLGKDDLLKYVDYLTPVFFIHNKKLDSPNEFYIPARSF